MFLFISDTKLSITVS